MKNYTTLITGQHADKPRFVNVVALTAGMLGAAGDVASQLIDKFDVDTAVGAQLDIIGLWVGIPRSQVVPIIGAFFSWNIPTFGWNESNWKEATQDSTSIITLDDETYRAVIKARIALNYWDGANDSANAIGAAVFAAQGVSIRLVDNMNMSLTVDVTGPVSAIMQSLIEQNQVFPKPLAVRVHGYTYGTTAPLLRLDGTWALDGTEALDGVLGAP